jgi:hypothetical protein
MRVKLSKVKFKDLFLIKIINKKEPQYCRGSFYINQHFALQAPRLTNRYYEVGFLIKGVRTLPALQSRNQASTA